MSRRGRPMYSPSQHAYTFVTVEKNGDVKIKRWRGSSCKTIKAAAKKRYPGARLGFGRCFWITD